MVAQRAHSTRIIALLSLTLLACSLRGQSNNPEEARLREFQAAEKAFTERRFEVAAAGYAKLAKLSPDSVEIHAKLGLSRFFERKCDQAAPAFERALELRPGLTTAEVLLAVCLSEMGRFEDALPGLEKGHKNPPNYEGMKRLLGLELQRSYLGLEKYAEAARVTAELHLSHPEDPEVLYHANRTYGELALHAVQQLTQVAPDSVWGHQAMGESYFSRQFYDLAITEYEKALAREPDRPGLHFRLGQAMAARAEDPSLAEDALDQFQQELAVNPNHASAAYQAGEIYRQKSQPGQALPYLEKAVELRPGFEEARLALGRALIELERPKEAKLHLEEAVGLNGENPASRYLLARAYRQLGDKENQREQLREYRRLQADRKKLDQSILLGAPPREPGAAEKNPSEGP